MIHRSRLFAAAVVIGLVAAAATLPGSTAATATTHRAQANARATLVRSPPRFPRVLLIGDSIAMGYTPTVRTRLRDSAAVLRIPVNAGATTYGLAHLQHWLGDGGWAVIHFNFGLHDLELVPGGHHLVPPAAYERNLQELVRQLVGTGATLIWASTTPVPPGQLRPRRRSGDVAVYNRIARRIMRANHIAIDDLYGFVLPREPRIQKPRNVHFTPAGYVALGSHVARSIAAALRATR